MKDKLEIEAEIRSLELVHSVVEDAHYKASTFYVKEALDWVLIESTERAPAAMMAEDYKNRETRPPARHSTAKTPGDMGKPGNPLSAPSSIIMEIEGERFLVPPFQWRDPGKDEEVYDWLKWFVGALQVYVKEVFGQVKVKDEK